MANTLTCSLVITHGFELVCVQDGDLAPHILSSHRRIGDPGSTE
jgi:hypothetical protein